MPLLRVTYFQRRRRDNRNFSLEQIFASVRKCLKSEIQSEVWTAPYTSSGIFRRLYICVSAAFAQADINHVTGDINFATFFMRRRKTVLTILDCGVLARSRGWKRQIIRLFWFQLPVWRSAIVTVISSATRNALLQEVKCDARRVRVIPVAISDAFKYSPAEFNTAKPSILHVGTAPNKNLYRVIESLAGLTCRLTIVGPLSDMERTCLAEHNIEYTNVQNLSQQELVRCYEECDILLFPSTYEGFGMPILEANAVGRVVVTSEVTSMPEVGGDAAFYVDPFNVLSIRDGVRRVIADGDLRSRLIQAGRRNVSRFNQIEVAKSYLRVYRELHGASHGAT